LFVAGFFAIAFAEISMFSRGQAMSCFVRWRSLSADRAVNVRWLIFVLPPASGGQLSFRSIRDNRVANVEGKRHTHAIYSKRVRPLHQMRGRHTAMPN